MSEPKQNIKGNNNIQVAQGNVIQTKKVKLVTEVIYDESKHISDAQAYEISKRIKEIAGMVTTNKPNNNAYAKEYQVFKGTFKITKYTLLPIEEYENAIKWLKKRLVYVGKKNLRHGNSPEWRKKEYIAINSRARQLKMDRTALINFAEEKLNLKSPLLSIKDLSDTRLKKLYKFIFAKK